MDKKYAIYDANYEELQRVQPGGVWKPKMQSAVPLTRKQQAYKLFGGFAKSNYLKRNYLVHHDRGLQSYDGNYTMFPESASENRFREVDRYNSARDWEDNVRSRSRKKIKNLQNSGIGILSKGINPFSKAKKIWNLLTKQSHRKFSARKRKTHAKSRSRKGKVTQTSKNRQQRKISKNKTSQTKKRSLRQSNLRRHVFRQGCGCTKCKNR